MPDDRVQHAGLTNALSSQQAAAIEYARIPAICARFGLSRSGVYRLADEGRLRLVKLRGSTLVDVQSVRALFAALPNLKK